MSTRTKTNLPGIFKSQTSRGVSYAVSYRDPSGKQHWRTFPTRQRALAFQAEQRTAIATGRYVEPASRRSKQVTVSDVVEAYLDSRKLKQAEATRAKQRRDARNHIAGTSLGMMPLQAVRKADVDDWLLDREQRLARSSLRNLATLLRSALKHAVEADLLVKAPVVDFTSRDIDDHDENPEEGLGVEVHPPTVEQVQALAAAMPTDVHAVMVLVQFGLGLRLGELLGLRACDVSLVGKRQVKVAGQLVQDGGGRRGKPKTRHSRRSVPLAPWVAEVMASHLAAHPAEGTDLVFLSPRTGRPFTHRRYAEAFRAAVRKAGLPDSTVTHDLRHAAATTWLRGGLSPVAVGRYLGHADGTLVLRVYGHYMPSDDGLAEAAMQDAWQAPARRLALA